MPADLLTAIEIETRPQPDASVIWLHGLGDDGHGWSQVVGALGLSRDVALRFIFPHAPVMPVAINNGLPMRAWYDISAADLNSRADLTGVRRSRAHVDALLAREGERGIASRRMIIAGFSQGGAMALYAGLRQPERLAGIVALSAYLIDAPSLRSEAAPANRDVPIFIAHGTFDQVVRYTWGESSMQALRAGGWPVEWHSYPMEHAAVPEEITAIGAFINEVLASTA